MKILLIRHGKAEERPLLSLSAKKDALRALTESGRREMRKAAKGLRKFAPDIDVLAASPLLRAQETADIVAKVFGVDEVREQALLSPGADAPALLDWLESHAAESTVALVGHEPDLSQFATWLLSGNEASFVTLKKGACALIEFDGKPAAGRGVLAWLLQPGQLRKLG
jgi:phosphohistidine phosphatase